VDYGLARHTLVGERIVVAQVCCRVVGSVVAASGRVEVRTEAAVDLRLEAVGSAAAVVGAREETMEVVGRTGRLAEAHSTVAVVGRVVLSRVSLEVCSEPGEAQTQQESAYHNLPYQVVLPLVSSVLEIFIIQLTRVVASAWWCCGSLVSGHICKCCCLDLPASSMSGLHNTAPCSSKRERSVISL